MAQGTLDRAPEVCDEDTTALPISRCVAWASATVSLDGSFFFCEKMDLN